MHSSDDKVTVLNSSVRLILMRMVNGTLHSPATMNMLGMEPMPNAAK